MRKSGCSKGKKAALPFQQLLQRSSVPPFSDRKANCDQEHGIVVGQNIGNVYGRVLCRVKIQEQDQQIIQNSTAPASTRKHQSSPMPKASCSPLPSSAETKAA